MTILCDLSAKYGTDKGWPHRYTPVYFHHLDPRREAIKRVLEIGICTTRDIKNGRTGASLFMWEEFFPNAEIFGIDIDPASMINEGRIKSAIANQGDPGSMARAYEAFGGQPFDLIVDDGSHDPIYQTAAAIIMLPRLAKGGLYFIEDIYVDPEIIKAGIDRAYPDHTLLIDVFEGGKMLPEGYGRREFGGPPAGEQLMVIEDVSV